jgi:hypothetical protein
MSLSRKQMIYGTVLTLAAGAFLWDRATSGPPPAAAAANDLLIEPTSQKPASAAKASEPSEASSSQAATVTATSTTLRERLISVAKANQIESGSAPNAFSLQDGWVPKKAADPTPTAVKPVPTDPDQKLAEAFRKHHLDGIVVGSNRTSYAIVDHNIVYVGQTFRQFKLLAVTKTTALFALRDAHVELRLAGAEDPSTQSDRADVTDNGGSNP